jgi:hypothetical protein
MTAPEACFPTPWNFYIILKYSIFAAASAPFFKIFDYR